MDQGAFFDEMSLCALLWKFECTSTARSSCAFCLSKDTVLLLWRRSEFELDHYHARVTPAALLKSLENANLHLHARYAFELSASPAGALVLCCPGSTQQGWADNNPSGLKSRTE
jgi:hypothetical protein